MNKNTTEEGNALLYNKEYYICFFDNHEFDKNTNQEKELYKPYKCVFHHGTSPNLWGSKVFEELENANKWCVDNKPTITE